MFSRILSGVLIGGVLSPVFAALPATTNYGLKGYGFGSGGGATSTSNYSLQGISGEVSGSTPFTANYTTKPGFIETEQANVPNITLSNPSNYYDKLKFVINNTSPNNPNNPSDALYEMQVCVGGTGFSGASCAGGGTLRYLKNDDTLGASLSLADYQTYTAWGGASGQNMIGLAANTTYYIRALATQGKYTESAYGPSSSAATVGQTLSYCLYSNANCAAGGNSVAFGNLLPATITAAPNNSGVFAIGTDFSTNADLGGDVYIYSLNGGLKSASASNYVLASVTGDLSSLSEGFGAQIVSVTQTSGGPLTQNSPYNVSGTNVGLVNSSIAKLFSTSSSPIVGGVGKIQLKVKPSNSTPSATDYTETLTLIAAASF